jgi:Tfp pilus assembly ATPase PilU
MACGIHLLTVDAPHPLSFAGRRNTACRRLHGVDTLAGTAVITSVRGVAEVIILGRVRVARRDIA